VTLKVGLEEHPLLFITDRHRSMGRDNQTVVRKALQGGCRWIQYREPDLGDGAFYEECLKIREECNKVGAGLIVNDRLDVAALVRAEGIHLGQGDLPVRVVKEYMGEDFLVGYSAHTLKEAITIAWEGADYITYSPMFQLSHKDTKHPTHGIDGAREVMKKLDIPVFLLGGIGLSDIKELSQAIHPLRVAVVSMLSEADDITATAEEALNILEPALKRDGS
jgi:thiamine-phosphate pyrophosphorylase